MTMSQASYTSVYNERSGENEIENKSGLTGQMSATSLCLSVLAFSAPIAVVEGFLPLTILFDGPGAPFAFLVTMALMLLFAVGYISMTRYIPKVGNFYAFISAGLGNTTGLGSAFLAIFSYLGILVGSYIFFGVSVSSLIESFHGPHTSWILWSVLGWLFVTTLGYFHVELSAKLLSIAMVIEVAIVMIFNVAVLFQGGKEGLSIEPLTPSAFTDGNIAITLLYTVLVFIGFEATALYRDEVKTPAKTIPKATFAAIIFIGVLYSLSSYSLVTAYGSDAWDVATNNPTTMFASAIGRFVSPVFEQITYCSVVISLSAALLSIHNVLSRYLLNLANDKALPASLSKVHEAHKSPYIASNWVGFIAALAISPFIINNANGETVYAIATGLGGLGIIFLMGLVSVAILAWFLKRGIPQEVGVFRAIIAPLLSAAAIFCTALVAVMHIDLVVGGTPGEYTWLVLLFVFVFAIGSMLSLYFKFKKPAVYALIGQSN